MGKELVIEFKNDGAVEALHMDAFDLAFLGTKKVFRQTDIVFDETTQLWNLVYLVYGSTRHYDDRLQGFSSYESARDKEVQWLNDCRLCGIDPVSEEGLEVMRELRAMDKPEDAADAMVKGTFSCESHKSVFDAVAP